MEPRGDSAGEQDSSRYLKLLRLLGLLVVALSLPLLLVFGLPWAVARYPESEGVIYAIGGVLTLILLGSILLRYLGDEPHALTSLLFESLKIALGPTVRLDATFSRDLLDQERRMLERQVLLSRMMDELQTRAASIPRTSLELSEQERTKLTEAIAEQITGRAGADLLTAVEEKYGVALAQSAYLQELRGHFERTRVRLLSEVNALSRRSNLNLVIGALTTVAAVVVLAYIALNTQLVVADWKAVLPSYLLRLSVVVFIEVFAFFFLRMYRANLLEIKYFQNELTSTEARFIALEAALVNGESDTTGEIIKVLGQTERNIVLNQGQTTIELERLRGENQNLKSILESVTGALRK